MRRIGVLTIRVAADCELASVGLHTQDLRLIVSLGASVGRRGRLRIRASCAEYTGRCEGGLILQAHRRGRPGAVLAQSPRRTVFTRRTRTVVLTVRPSVARRLRARGTTLLYLAGRSRGGRPGSVPLWVRTAGRTS